MQVIADRVQLSAVSIIKQYDACMDFYDKHINKGEIINSAYRRSFEELPKIAYREAVANALIHRDYSRRGNCRIEFFEDRIEIVSIGGLAVGISEEEYVQGQFSMVRNRILGDIFFRCGIIEKMGTGIRRIKQAYRHTTKVPSFIVMENSIKVILPKLSIGGELLIDNKSNRLLDVEEDKLLNYIRSTSGVNRAQIELYMAIKKTKATKMINQFLKEDLIIKIGSGRTIQYKVK